MKGSCTELLIQPLLNMNSENHYFQYSDWF